MKRVSGWFVVVSAFLIGCGGGMPLDDARCGPREDLVGVWQRDSDRSRLRLDLDATLEWTEDGVTQLGRYQVSDKVLRLFVEDRITESAYCVRGGTLRIKTLGAPFRQLE